MEPTFYFSVPQGDRTGGPECLHQLADAVTRRGYRAVLLPMYNFRGKTPHPEYDIYRYEIAEAIEDPNDAVLVLSEVSPIETFRELRLVPKSRTWMWWLSVHNGPDPRSRYFRGSDSCCSFRQPASRGPVDSPLDVEVVAGPVHKTPYANASVLGLLRESWTRTVAPYSPGRSPRTLVTEYVSLLYNRRVIESGIGFMAQSVYAQGFCKSILGREAMPLTDYMRRPSINPQPLQSRTVLYNGAKGYSMVGQLAERLPEMHFRPIENMTFVEVCEALAGAAAYVELGVPPGRDRLPREAAHFGTPSVLLCRGAAYCWDDFPLPAKYRIPFVENWAELMAPVVRDVVQDRPQAVADQAHFREWVAGDRERYEVEVDDWLEAVLRAF